MTKPMASDGTVGKALEVLDAVAAFERPVRFTELLEAVPFPKATLYRFLQTLTNQKMLSYDAKDGTYSMGVRLLRLAHASWRTASLAPIARPFLRQLSDTVGEAVHLAQIDNGQVIFVDKLIATDRFDTLAQIGQVAPAYCTGVGKAMLAFMAPRRLELALRQQAYLPYTPTTHRSPDSLLRELETVRRDGLAFDREEHEQGIVSIAAPVLSTNGRVIGAISIATTTARHDLNGLQAFRSVLQTTAEQIGAEATSWQFPA
ncbi:Transcriptional regulator KdgR [Rhodobacteraceae bacterium THAF1]|uniref:IclR family transcriptional regulator n=1 Tax=Palleronia sp. THAF1 TaxID=2587842 RepID=UPI000F3E3AEE|nr:IclR family transcriptional regulator [Palleronia sp. THAF1]QFU08529.1 Transcriptional regulator KdgR [Palleronia sp. THAF1]VDC30577.1 Transcriptional regulator KdgR [Rhodobacteraceae bacterium THAF1]